MLRYAAILVCAIAFGTFITSSAFAQVSYRTSWSQQLNGAAGIALADFNRDGLPDLAVLNNNVVSVFFNQGGGVFGNQHDTPIPSDSYRVKAADVNGDGKTDLVIQESSTPNIVILLGNGDGTFQAPINVGLTDGPTGFALGDFNNDGKLDLVAKTCSSVPKPNNTCELQVMLGHGDGTFTTSALLPAGAAGRFDVVATDFNRDGRLDLVTSAPGPSRALVWFGNGNGTFRSPIALKVNNPIPAGSVEDDPEVAAADFNGDGVDDIAVMAGSVCGGSACGTANISIFLSNGTGGFTFKSEFQDPNQFGTEDMRTTDLNNDLRQDIVSFNDSMRTGDVNYWLGSGSGSFGARGNIGEASDTQFRDLDLDGRHDFVSGESIFGMVTVNLNQNGTPNCAPPPSDRIRAKICAPGASVGSTTFTVRGSGNSPVGIQRLELWVDGTKRYQVRNDQLQKSLTLAAGKHRIAVIAVDQYIGSASTVEYVSVP